MKPLETAKIFFACGGPSPNSAFATDAHSARRVRAARTLRQKPERVAEPVALAMPVRFVNKHEEVALKTSYMKPLDPKPSDLKPLVDAPQTAKK